MTSAACNPPKALLGSKRGKGQFVRAMAKKGRKSAANPSRVSAQAMGSQEGVLAPVWPGLEPAVAGRKRASARRSPRKLVGTQADSQAGAAAAGVATDMATNGDDTARSASPPQQSAPTPSTRTASATETPVEWTHD
jgi:hypothetical protein